MEEKEPEQIDTTNTEWRSPDEPINETRWEIVSEERPVPVKSVLTGVAALLLLGVIVYFAYRKLSRS